MPAYQTNLGLSALPEIDQHKAPEIYAELVRIRNALTVLQRTVDILSGGTVGQKLTKNSSNNFDASWI
jgi:hypothetical protein